LITVEAITEKVIQVMEAAATTKGIAVENPENHP
jgi:hypothetical protein